MPAADLVLSSQKHYSRLKERNFENGKNDDHGGELASMQEIIK